MTTVHFALVALFFISLAALVVIRLNRRDDFEGEYSDADSGLASFFNQVFHDQGDKR